MIDDDAEGVYTMDEAELWLWAWKAGQYVAEGHTPRDAANLLMTDLAWTVAMETVDPS